MSENDFAGCKTLQADDVLNIINSAIGSRLDSIVEQLNKLNVEVGSIHGAHNEQLKSLEHADDRHERRIDALELRVGFVNPELWENRHKVVLDKISELRLAVETNSKKNEKQDEQHKSTLVEIIKWIGIPIAAALGGWLLKHLT